MTPEDALKMAAYAAAWSGCRKSKRGCVVWAPNREPTMALASDGWNHRPDLGTVAVCDGSDACRAVCNRVCVHAEADALLTALERYGPVRGWHLLHVKVADGRPVPRGERDLPCWQCARLVLRCSIGAVWCLHPEGLRSYTATEAHTIALDRAGIRTTGGPVCPTGGDSGAPCEPERRADGREECGWCGREMGW